MTAKSSSVLKWLNIVAFLSMVLVNGLAGSTTLIGGKNTAQISNSNPTLITPAGYVFSIWGIIYLLLGVFVVFQALPPQRVKDFQKKIGGLFILSSILNILWLFLWQLEYLISSVVVIFLLLATLILIYLRLGIGKTMVSLRKKLAVHAPFSIYLGWITIASIANVAVALVSINWGGFGINPQIWATLIILVALLITLTILITRKDLVYGLVVIWALVGIAVNQSGNQNILLITGSSAIILTISLAILIFLPLLKINTQGVKP